jgi:hypothetical protein
MTDDKEVNTVFDMLSFVLALICGPIVGSAAVALILVPLFGVAGEPVVGLFIPFVAVVVGALPYLVFGTPVFLSMVKREPPDVLTYALGGVIADVLFGLCTIFAVMLLAFFDIVPGGLFFIWLFGIPFSAAWGGAFGGLYRFFLTARSARGKGSEGHQS